MANPVILVAADDASADQKAIADHVCTGTQDNVDIQQAIDDAAALGSGGTVQLTSAQFNITATLKLKTGVILRGEGRSHLNPMTGTRIHRVTTSIMHGIELADSDVAHCQIRDLVLKGNKGTQTSGHGIFLNWTGTTLNNAPRVLIENVLVTNWKENGIEIVQPLGAGGVAADLIGTIVSDCDGDAFVIDGLDVFATHCIAVTCGGSGWRIKRGAFQGANIKGDTCAKGLYLDAGTGAKISNFHGLRCSQEAVLVESDRNTLTGILLSDNGGDPAQPAFLVKGEVDGLVVTGLHIDSVSNKNSWGIVIEDPAENISIDFHAGGALANGPIDQCSEGNNIHITGPEVTGKVIQEDHDPPNTTYPVGTTILESFRSDSGRIQPMRWSLPPGITNLEPRIRLRLNDGTVFSLTNSGTFDGQYFPALAGKQVARFEFVVVNTGSGSIQHDFEPVGGSPPFRFQGFSV